MTVMDELLWLEHEHGVLRPEDVVAFARDGKTALHSRFTWDDGVAAHQYRLWEARNIINVAVTVIESSDAKRTTRAFVSLTTDRTQEGGGYRSTVVVLSDADMRAQLLQDAYDELKRWRLKYQELRELTKVFTAIDELSIEPEREEALA